MKNTIHKKPKISLIGSGNIGGTCAFLLAIRNIADIVLFDIVEDLPQGKALDIAACIPIEKSEVSILGTNNYSDIADSDIIIVTAGLVRNKKSEHNKQGFSRADLLNDNSKIIKEVAKNIKKYSPNAFIIVTTNPLDAMTWYMQKITGFSKNMVVGMAGGLDSSRFSYFIGKALKISPKDIQTTLIGEHGNTMLPLVRFSHVNNSPLDKLLNSIDNNQNIVDEATQKTKTAGGKIVNYMNTSAYYSPAIATLDIATAYLNNKKQTILCSTLLEGEYGINDLCVGVPAVIGSKGVEQIKELDLNNSEQQDFIHSVNTIDGLVSILKKETNSC
ncbi:MAG: malate dehydrogenase [Rickettsiales bacterium]|nr:malate dehydrogenase [Rickettsiales bacterium]